MYVPPEDEDVHAREGSSRPTVPEYAYEHAQLPLPSARSYNPWPYQSHSQAYEATQHPTSQGEPASHPESSLRSTSSAVSYGPPSPIYMHGYREETISLQRRQHRLPFVGTDANDVFPESTVLLQPTSAGTSQSPHVRFDHAQMVHSQVHQPLIPAEQLLPPPTSAAYYAPAHAVQGCPSRRNDGP
ncbi:hypothetical protein CONPUDRAFT_83964 [Coniophora puteana RWD-64-598 SS2]|uniref:Uncharacterized protein n=1 Tax=Coniophora puteana (strain RWD-64-598) TaxID=741705 RepID=A0A5M3MHS4_CONPW|nr:uncharacterized protein CONPUDRAFT_83964 [Coniophora puteana RWD-64-598 SS2]EIW78653.1 hypothetical protein CONPUDRAFT_83964 [Coniophora puteana RWD-64-598 SS2]